MASQLLPVIIRIKQRMSEDPKIRDSSHVTISDQTKGVLMMQKHYLQIIGRVNTQEELNEINAIVNEEAEGFDVENTVRVHYR